MGQDGGGASMSVCKEVTEGEQKPKDRKNQGKVAFLCFYKLKDEREGDV